ncbi:Tfp pilus assembly protein FimT/FimU [Candidatus Auribacterota bacterium]
MLKKYYTHLDKTKIYFFWKFIRKNISGISLVEILTVIVIMSLLSLLAAPMLSRFTRNLKLKNSAKILAATIRLGRTLAVTKNTNYLVRFQLDSNSKNEDIVSIIRESDSQLYGKIWKTPTSIDIRDINNTTTGIIDILCTPKGTCYSTLGVSCSIHLEKTDLASINRSSSDPEERVKCNTLVVSSATGHITIYPYGKNNPWLTTEL